MSIADKRPTPRMDAFVAAQRIVALCTPAPAGVLVRVPRLENVA